MKDDAMKGFVFLACDFPTRYFRRRNSSMDVMDLATAFSKNTLKKFILHKDSILHRYPLDTHGMNYFKNIA